MAAPARISAGAQITADTRQLEATLRHLPEALAKGLHNAAGRVGKRYLSHHAKARMRAAPPPPPPGRSPVPGVRGTRGKPGRPGFLSAFRADVTGRRLDDLQLRMWIRSAAAEVHELGGVRLPRRGKYMTIPMPAAKDKNGRLTAKAKGLLRQSLHLYQASQVGTKLYNRKGNPIKGLFRITRRRDGKHFLVTHAPIGRSGRRRRRQGGKTVIDLKTGRNPNLIFWFHLVKSAHFRPRLDYYTLWKSWASSDGMRIFAQSLHYCLLAAQRRAKAGGAA